MVSRVFKKIVLTFFIERDFLSRYLVWYIFVIERKLGKAILILSFQIVKHWSNSQHFYTSSNIFVSYCACSSQTFWNVRNGWIKLSSRQHFATRSNMPLQVDETIETFSPKNVEWRWMGMLGPFDHGLVNANYWSVTM